MPSKVVSDCVYGIDLFGWSLLEPQPWFKCTKIQKS